MSAPHPPSPRRSRPPPAGGDFVFPPSPTQATYPHANTTLPPSLQPGAAPPEMSDRARLGASMLAFETSELPYASGPPVSNTYPAPHDVPLPMSPPPPPQVQRFQLSDARVPPPALPADSRHSHFAAFAPPTPPHVVPHDQHFAHYNSARASPLAFVEPPLPPLPDEHHESTLASEKWRDDRWQPQYDNLEGFEDEELRRKKRKKFLVIGVIVGILAIIIVCVGVGVGVSNSKKGSEAVGESASSGVSDSSTGASSLTSSVSGPSTNPTDSGSVDNTAPLASASNSQSSSLPVDNTSSDPAATTTRRRGDQSSTEAVTDPVTSATRTRGNTVETSLPLSSSSIEPTTNPVATPTRASATAATSATAPTSAAPGVECVTGGVTIGGVVLGGSTQTLAAGQSCPTAASGLGGRSRTTTDATEDEDDDEEEPFRRGFGFVKLRRGKRHIGSGAH